MKLLKEIIHRPGLQISGKTLTREAVRGIILNQNKLLLIYSATVGDYKFPGGGIAVGETHAQALAREIEEECGTRLAEFGPAFGKMVEYDLPVEAEFEVFKMTSYYYRCQVTGLFQEQSLEQYEADLGFLPVWVEVDAAIQANQSLLAGGYQRESRWVERETFVLEQIREELT